MGPKISVDSATLMNKGLEVIEAWHLFPVEKEQIDVIIHPQSVIHSMVSYVDGSVLAQLGSPDMKTPISYALNWPSRMDSGVTTLDLAGIARLDFEEPDENRFPALKMARQALQTGGGAPTILNAANEVAVEFFLNGALAFLDIPKLVESVLSNISIEPLESLDHVMEVDAKARVEATQRASRRN
jgi:1-deoxy-D-xylulose-5-phosphate reductoisomerase